MSARKQKPEPSVDFNPYTLRAHFHIPDVVMNDPRLTWGAKCLYAILGFHLGKPKPEGNFCCPDPKKIADRMHVYEKTVIRWRAELIKYRYGKVRRNGPNPGEWVFLEPPVDTSNLSDLDTSKMIHQDALDHSFLSNRYPKNDPLDHSFLSVPYKEENSQENSHKNSSSGAAQTSPAPRIEPARMMNSKNEDRKEPAVPNQAFSQEQIAEARERLKGASKQPYAPDPKKAVEFLEASRTFPRFRDWLDDVVKAGRNQKINSYAGFLTDCRRWNAQHQETSQSGGYPTWVSPLDRMTCQICCDDSDGMVESNNILDWCTCEHAQRMRQKDPGLLARRQAEWDETLALTEQCMKRAEKPPARREAPPKEPEVPEDPNRLLESVACAKCGGSIRRYAKRIESCDCKPSRALRPMLVEERAPQRRALTA